MRVAVLGVGTIGGFVLEALAQGLAGEAHVVAAAGRDSPRSRSVAERFTVPCVAPDRLPDHHPDVIVEAASHEALRAYVPAYLRAGIDVVTLSAGALADDRVTAALTAAAREGRSRLYVPSGGIAGLDGIKALVLEGADVTLTSAKPPAAWRGVPHVSEIGVDLDTLRAPTVLYDGAARGAVALFPQNVNIAAALSLAGVGFDRTRVRVLADPGIDRNIHEILATGPRGTIRVRLENVPTPTNPRTAYLAAFSAVATLRQLAQPLWIGV